MYYSHQKESYEQKENKMHEEQIRTMSSFKNFEFSSKSMKKMNSSSSFNSFKINIRSNNIYGENQIKFLLDGFKLILIDDHSNTFYPFLNFSIDTLEINNISNSIVKNRNSIININNLFENNDKQVLNELKGEICLKLLTYNYIAGEWEPLLEKCEIEFND